MGGSRIQRKVRSGSLLEEETTSVLPGRRRDSALRADLRVWSEL